VCEATNLGCAVLALCVWALFQLLTVCEFVVCFVVVTAAKGWLYRGWGLELCFSDSVGCFLWSYIL